MKGQKTKKQGKKTDQPVISHKHKECDLPSPLLSIWNDRIARVIKKFPINTTTMLHSYSCIFVQLPLLAQLD
jgi:hypothetical protein